MIIQYNSILGLTEIYDWTAILYAVISILLLIGAKVLNQKWSGYNLDHQLTTEDNKAVAVSFAGFLLSLCLIINGVLTSPSESSSLGGDLLATVIWGSIASALLVLSRAINDKLILPKFSNRKELIEDRNIGIGAVQAGGYIATALIIRAVFMSESTSSLGSEVMLTLGWFIVTQALFLLFTFAYQKFISFDLHKELENDNIAVGISFGGSLVAFGILLSLYLSQYDHLLGLIIWAIVAMFLLKGIRLATDKLLLPKQSLDDELVKDQNWGAAIIEAVVSIGGALILTGSLY